MPSNIRKKLANLSVVAEDENTTTETTETPEAAAPAEETTPEATPAADTTTTEAPAENNESDDAFLKAIQDCGIQLANPEAALKGQQWGRLGAFDLLNTNEFATQIMSAGSTQAAAKLVMDKINELDSKLGSFKQYNKLGEQAKKTLQVRMMRAKNPRDIVFLLSNSGLKGSGMSSTLASAETMLRTALAQAGLEKAHTLLAEVENILIEAADQDEHLQDLADKARELAVQLERFL